MKHNCAVLFYLFIYLFIYYRPQTKFGARQYFCTCLPFCSQGGWSIWAGTPPGRYPQAGTPPWAGSPPPQQVHPLPPGRYTPQAGTPPQAGTHPPSRYIPPGRYPLAGTPQQCMLGYGQQVGGTHPTGMYSCLFMLSKLFSCWQPL